MIELGKKIKSFIQRIVDKVNFLKKKEKEETSA